MIPKDHVHVELGVGLEQKGHLGRLAQDTGHGHEVGQGLAVTDGAEAAALPVENVDVRQVLQVEIVRLAAP